MEDNYSFVNILKYQDTKKKTQLENYTTELFVFVLNYLKNRKIKILSDLLREFDFFNARNFNNLILKTQSQMEINQDKPKPDIIIEYNGRRIIIEVKVDSKLNTYEYKNKQIDQVEYYEKISGFENNVYLLSKNIIDIKDNKKRILWSKIYTIINKKNDFVLNNFAKHLEVNGMGNNKLTNGILNAVSSIKNLHSLLIQSWIYDDEYGNYSFSPTMEYLKDGWLSCYIYDEKKGYASVTGTTFLWCRCE